MQAAFVQEYLIDRNGRAAAVRAGYSPKTAQEQSSRLLSIVKVKEAVNKGFQDHAKTCEITRESILKEYQKDQEEARKLGQYSVSTSINHNISKMYGLDGQTQLNVTGKIEAIERRFINVDSDD